VARVEREHHFVGFSHQIETLGITSRMTLGQVTDIMERMPFGSTDCAAPMLHALHKGIEADVFVVYTDNETNSSRSMHPSEALRRYRRETGIDAKLIVAGLTATGFTIADPKDAGMLDVVGFDAKAVSIMGDFVRT
jgi:60 kDa SS-A/Ro ribonucleoprotein